VSPAELSFRRKLKTRLPGIEEHAPDDTEIRERDNENKQRGEMYADDRRNTRDSDILEGDEVLLKQRRENKLTTNFEQDPYRVILKTGNSVVTERDGVKYKRNMTYLKKLHEREPGRDDPIRESVREPWPVPEPVREPEPERVATERVTPERVAAERVMPERVTTERVTPDRDTLRHAKMERSRPVCVTKVSARFKDFVMS